MDLRSLGWNDTLRDAFEPFQKSGFVPARITALQANRYTAFSELGELTGMASGKLKFEARDETELPCVGDWVAVKADPGMLSMRIRAVLPRRTVFMRARYDNGAYAGDQIVSANVDVLFTVLALDQEFNANKAERYLILGKSSGARNVLVLNKADLCSDVDAAVKRAREVAGDADIILSSVEDGRGIEELRSHLGPGVTGSLVGPSGVGKSSLINALLGEKRLDTGSVRDGDSKGRHTTTSRELVLIASGGMLIDNPGMRGIGVTDSDEAVSESFDDIEALIARCRFSDCRHETEPGCAVKVAIAKGELTAERLDQYLRLRRELEVIAVKKSQRSRLGKGLAKAIKQREKLRKSGQL